MIDSIRKSYDIEAPSSWMIGDSYKDIVAGNKAGLRTIQVLTGAESYTHDADFVEEDLVKAVNRILIEK